MVVSNGYLIFLFLTSGKSDVTLTNAVINDDAHVADSPDDLIVDN
jgi:hypothetical protein